MIPTSALLSQILFLPGALGNQDFWEPLARELKFPANKVLMEYPGFAGVPADPSINSLSDLVDLIVSRINCPTALIAQSMGGVLAIETALRKPSVITHIVLAATSGGLNTARLGAIDWRQAFQHQHPELPDWFPSYNSDLTDNLSTIKVPILLIWGDHDSISPVAIGEELFRRFPNAELHVVPGGEHDVASAHARTIVSLVEAHLRKRSSFS